MGIIRDTRPKRSETACPETSQLLYVQASLLERSSYFASSEPSRPTGLSCDFVVASAVVAGEQIVQRFDNQRLRRDRPRMSQFSQLQVILRCSADGYRHPRRWVLLTHETWPRVVGDGVPSVSAEVVEATWTFQIWNFGGSNSL